MTRQKNENLKRVNINIPKKLDDDVKRFANYYGVNITSAYILLLNKAVYNKTFLKDLKYLVDSISKNTN